MPSSPQTVSVPVPEREPEQVVEKSATQRPEWQQAMAKEPRFVIKLVSSIPG